MMTLAAHVEGIALIGPGLDDWSAARAVLRGEAPYSAQPTNLPAASALPPSERRRASRAIKIALAAGFGAIAGSGRDPASLATVFSSSSGDGYNCHELCQQLASGDRQISPTRFHNSVHNAPAGYWSIASGAMATSSVLCAADASFGAGLLEALAQVCVERIPVALVAYDTDYPEPLRATRPVPDAMGVGLVLAPERSARTIAVLRAATTAAAADASDRLDDPALESLRLSIPAARALPLLRALARGDPGAAGRVVIDYLPHMRLVLEVAA